MSIFYFNIGPNETNPVQEFVLSYVINEDAFKQKVTNKFDFITNIIMWLLIFIGAFIVLLILAIYMFIKIANRSLTPLKNLNYKVSTLVKTNGQLNLGNTNNYVTSYEVTKMYEVFSELITAKRFADNNLFDKNDALAIMDYAEAHTVFKDNIKAQGI